MKITVAASFLELIVLFAFRPQDRALSEVIYKLFFNALLESGSTPVALSNGAMSRN